jgi:hypothetical protein
MMWMSEAEFADAPAAVLGESHVVDRDAANQTQISVKGRVSRSSGPKPLRPTHACCFDIIV